MQYEIKQDEKFRFIEEGIGEPLLLLHGLFGALSNFSGQIDYFRQQYKVVVPILPLLDLDLIHTTVGGLEKYVHKFIEYRDYKDINLLGNSLGGHVALLYVLRHPERIRSLTLTGSSGLFENGMGDTYPKRQDYEYIRKKTELTFFDPKIATKELVDELYETVNVSDLIRSGCRSTYSRATCPPNELPSRLISLYPLYSTNLWTYFSSPPTVVWIRSSSNKGNMGTTTLYCCRK